MSKKYHRPAIPYRDTDWVCEQCATVFRTRKACSSRIPRFCSIECFGKSLIRESYCEQCGAAYHTSKKHGRRNKHFCSKVCGAEWLRGKKLSSEHRESLSRAKKGRAIPHLHTQEVRDKISQSLIGKPQPWNRGPNHPLYKDGGTANVARQKAMGRVEYKEWRRQVFARDDFTCQCCGQRGGRLQAHHIKEWSASPDLRFDVSNGVTLCRSCHYRFHSNEELPQESAHNYRQAVQRLAAMA